ncbi:MAG TPA: TauD/TfdA family dioxygenase [Candidatus Binataceae bacterium]|nr:TauD/TfdA family dioxygenase [Candidatus Binataceae bacterium]
MALAFRHLHPGFAAEASGIDLRYPIGADVAAEIEAAMDRFAVLVFRDQPLNEEQQIAFSSHFGPLDMGLRKAFKNNQGRFKHAETIDISNVDVDGAVLARDDFKSLANLANQLWHSDSSFQRPAAKYSMLTAHVLPSSGGDTEYADERAAYDLLPAEMQRQIEDLVGEHSALYSRMTLADITFNDEERAVLPPVLWPLVRIHPGSRRKTLFLGAHITHVLGMTVAEGRLLVRDLMEHATQREFVYRHRWRVGDLVIWDNRCVMHRGRPYDLAERRELRRTTNIDLLGAEEPLPQRAAS